MAMPVDVDGLDLTYGPGLADRIGAAGAPRTLVLGLVDGRNTKLETRDGLFPILDRALKGLRGPVALGPSCGLELLPRARARAKLENMVALAREYTGQHGRTR
jgi:methionine synthase II (cobalamin-independent)